MLDVVRLAYHIAGSEWLLCATPVAQSWKVLTIWYRFEVNVYVP
jgi:hypothetical protein